MLTYEQEVIAFDKDEATRLKVIVNTHLKLWYAGNKRFADIISRFQNKVFQTMRFGMNFNFLVDLRKRAVGEEIKKLCNEDGKGF